MKGLKQTIKEFRAEAWSEADGSLADLANVLLRVIHNFEHKGIKYVIKRHYQRR